MRAVARDRTLALSSPGCWSIARRSAFDDPQEPGNRTTDTIRLEESSDIGISDRAVQITSILIPIKKKGTRTKRIIKFNLLLSQIDVLWSFETSSDIYTGVSLLLLLKVGL